MPALWSVHDVMPGTFERCARIVARLEAAGVGPLSILVTPAGEWPPEAVAELRAWAARGHELAAHGWTHKSPPPKGLYHRIHSLVLSRDAAEHLGRSRAEAAEIVTRSRDWFAANGLPTPVFYVPPAWAMGAMPMREMRELGFTRVETLMGVHDIRRGSLRLLPLAGFEADTWFRAVSLRALNAINVLLGRVTRRPVRFAVHPDDFELRLGGALRRAISNER